MRIGEGGTLDELKRRKWDVPNVVIIFFTFVNNVHGPNGRIC